MSKRPKTPPLPERLATREIAAKVEAADLAAYEPSETDRLIAQAMFEGAQTLTDLGRALDMDPNFLGRRLRDPVTSAWVSAQIQHLIRQNMGLVDLALYQKARLGSVAAIERLYDRFGTDRPGARQAAPQTAIQMNFGALSDEQLRRLAAETTRGVAPEEGKS